MKFKQKIIHNSAKFFPAVNISVLKNIHVRIFIHCFHMKSNASSSPFSPRNFRFYCTSNHPGAFFWLPPVRQFMTMSTPMLLKSKVNENTDFIFPVVQTKKSCGHSWLLPFSFMPYPIHWQILLILPLQEIENATFSHFLHGHHLGLSDCHLPGGLHSPPGRSPCLSPYALQSISNIAASMILLKQVRS